MNIMYLGGVDLDTLVLLFAVIVAAATLILITVALIRQGKNEQQEQKPRRESEARRKRLDVFNRIARELGLDKVLVRELESMISEGLEKGRVRLSLASDECPGYVVLDVPSRRFLCVHEGRVWPIGEPEVGDEVEVEEVEGEAREYEHA